MFQTGSQINPALGRIDYSTYAQGAIAGGQAIGQGIANLGQGIASGIEQYAKQKKESKQLEAKLKGSIASLEGLGQIAKGVSPEADSSYTGLMAKLNDPSISTAEKVALSDAAQGTLKELISFGIQANTRRDAATATNLAIASAKSGKPIPSIYNPEIMASASSQALKFANEQAQIDETKAKTNALKIAKPTETVYTDPAAAIAAGLNALQLSKAEGYDVLPTLKAGGYGYELVKQTPPREAPVGFRFNLDGSLSPIVGGPVDLAQKAEQAKLETKSVDAQKRLNSQYKDVQKSALNNLNKIKKATNLVREGFLASGFGSGVGGFFGGSPGKDLEAQLTSIKSSLAVDKIIELKNANPDNPSTGFGALNLKELEVLQSDISNLDRSQSDVSLVEALNSIYDRYASIMSNLPEEYQFYIPDFADNEKASLFNEKPSANNSQTREVPNSNADENIRAFRRKNNLR